MLGSDTKRELGIVCARDTQQKAAVERRRRFCPLSLIGDLAHDRALQHQFPKFDD